MIIKENVDVKLTEEEEEHMMKEIQDSPEALKLSELPISYEEKGKEIGKKEVARKMLKAGSDLEFIAKVTQLDLKEIEKLRKQL